MRKIFKSKIQMKKLNIRGDEIAVLFVGLIFFLFLMLSCLRLFAVGKLIDDFCFLLLFGWNKYLVYLLLFIFITPVFFNRYFKIKFSFVCAIVISLFVLSWTIQNLYYVFQTHDRVWFNWKFFQIQFVKSFTINWWHNSIINNYHGFFGPPVAFNNWGDINSFFPPYACGGLISAFLLAISSYGFFVSSFLLNLLCLIVCFSWLFFDAPWLCFSGLKRFGCLIKTQLVIMSRKIKKTKKRRLTYRPKAELPPATQKLVPSEKSNFILKFMEKQVEKAETLASSATISQTTINFNHTPTTTTIFTAPPKPTVTETIDLKEFSESNQLTPFGPMIKFGELPNDDLLMTTEPDLELPSMAHSATECAIPETNVDLTTSESEQINTFIFDNHLPRKKDGYVLPTLQSLPVANKWELKQQENEQYAASNQVKINQLFQEFAIQGKVENYYLGTTVTKYEVATVSGMRVNKITSLEDELKLALATNNIRIEAPIPGKSLIGIEVANQHIVPVTIQDQIKHLPTNNQHKQLIIAIGRTTLGNYLFHSLKDMPHLLIAGSTGSGKSVFINDLLISLLLQYSPKEVKLLLIDPKWVELAMYNDIPHLLHPIINDAKKVPTALKLVITEMMRRYKLLANHACRNIDSYNKKVKDQVDKLPYYVIVIDELADLMVQNSKEIEEGIMRITQMGRAAGIHLVVATQRPSTDIITGVIKNNIPSRIAFQVASWIDSRTIIDYAGAEKLLGKGDMLFLAPGQNGPIRVQAPWISEDEVINLIEFIKNQAEPNYDLDFIGRLETDS